MLAEFDPKNDHSELVEHWEITLLLLLVALLGLGVWNLIAHARQSVQDEVEALAMRFKHPLVNPQEQPCKMSEHRPESASHLE